MMRRSLLARFRRVVGLVVVTLTVCAGASRAQAHPALDEAKQLASELEFEASLAAFDAALASGTLTRAELVQLLSERAFVLHALRRPDDLVRDFVWLSALAPDHRLDLRAPPDLVATWTSVRDQGRGPLKVTLDVETRSDGSFTARAQLTGTVPEGARPRLWLRRGSNPFVALSEPAVRGQARAAEAVALYADALTLGGVVLAGEHSAAHPRLVPANPKPIEEEPRWARRHKGWLIGGAALVAVAAIVVAVVLTRPDEERSDKTNLKPMVTF